MVIESGEIPARLHKDLELQFQVFMEPTMKGNAMGCNNCGKELIEVFDGSGRSQQYVDALHLTLNPGYAEYFDGDHPIDMVLCKSCTAQMLLVLPGIKQHIESELDKQFE